MAALHPDPGRNTPHAAHDLQRRNRWIVAILGVLGGACFVGSWFLPWWHYALHAPQYPKGLLLDIWLTGVTGDITEIDILNHYIGMQSMADAASFERAISAYIIGLIALALPVGALVFGRRLNIIPLLISLVMPVVFVIDINWWMYSFGHDLNPKAPLHIKPFMPNLFGHGKVAQFETWAWAAPGFWLAIAGVVIVAFAMWLRSRICRTCPHADDCGGTCPYHLVAVPPGE